MTVEALARHIDEGLREVPLFDIHTHLVGGRLGAAGLHDVLLYHMLISDLYSAGCPNGRRLTQFPGEPGEAEAHSRIVEALPFLRRVVNTSSYWGLRLVLRDLYGWEREITDTNWRELDGVIRERAADRGWAHSVLDRAAIRLSGTELARRGAKEGDGRLVYALEWGFFTRCQWGEFDTALYELERCWGRTPDSPAPIGAGPRPPTDRVIHSVDDVHAAVEHYVSAIPFPDVYAMATHISTDISFGTPTEDELAQALKARDGAGPAERDLYASYVNEALLTALEPHADAIVFQFSLGAEPLPFETGSRLGQRTIAQLAEMIARHSDIRFQCFLASAHGNQSLCTLARELPNLSLAGYWWHSFFPEVIGRTISERLDMLPVNKQVGFFSDAYCVEWAYAKACIVRKLLSQSLAQRVMWGQYDASEALRVAESILWSGPRELLGV